VGSPCSLHFSPHGSGIPRGSSPRTTVPKASRVSVRNTFKILGCHKRDDTTQKSIGKAKFISAEGCTPGSLEGMHTRQEVCRGFI
jgi:hypothetical protein